MHIMIKIKVSYQLPLWLEESQKVSKHQNKVTNKKVTKTIEENRNTCEIQNVKLYMRGPKPKII